jgi:DUF1680 family protein
MICNSLFKFAKLPCCAALLAAFALINIQLNLLRAAVPDAAKSALAPPMGWNSWDCYGASVTEDEVKANADYMAKNLSPLGWKFIVVDIRWTEQSPQPHAYNKNPQLTLDEHGRFIPAPARFPSSAGGQGFKPLSAYVHAAGLKFGIHIMRGIPKAARDETSASSKGYPIADSTFSTLDVPVIENSARWLPDMLGVAKSEAGQAYYNSLFKLYADWGVDFVKVDDLDTTAGVYYVDEIDMIRAAIDKSGRPMVLSVSPGPVPLSVAGHVSSHANMWRVANDLWDRWGDIYPQFERLNQWNRYRAAGHWPDADMLPLGRLAIRSHVGNDRQSKLTHDEQCTVMTLWCIARSPLIFGGDLSSIDEWTRSLITNPEVIAVDQQSLNNHQLFHNGDQVAWIADALDRKSKYLALFNQGNPDSVKITIKLSDLALSGSVKARDLWAPQDLGAFDESFAADVAAHGAGLYRLTQDSPAAAAPKIARDYPIRPVPANQVQFADSFWAPRIETNRTVTIPACFAKCEDTGRIENFKVAAGKSDKNWVGVFGFDDSDVSKIMEGAAYSLMTHPNKQLSTYLDELIGDMADAQESDGYLETVWTARDRLTNPGKIICRPRTERWLGEADSHELYNAGHMYEAAAAHFQATGQANFLDVATKNADLLVQTFGRGKIELPPGHPEVELGLVKLYRATGDQRYLDLAKFFIDVRGTPTKDRPKLWGEYNQDHKPFRDQKEAVGHAVRAAYLYAAATDVAALTGDETLTAAVDGLWDNVVGKKQYLTGGIGSRAQGEAFGNDFELPNRTAYCETCAGIAFCLWAERMFLLHGDAKYIDALEHALYNNVVDGVSLDGTEFFYPNPLASNGDKSRSKWFDCSCCPTNICRFIPSVPGYTYASRIDSLYVNLFAAGTSEIPLDQGKVRIEQRTNYPWDGHVAITVRPETDSQRIALHLRIPGWARGEAWPSDLYRFLDKSGEQVQLAVNGHSKDIALEHGYAVVDQAWKDGDTVTLELPMPVRRVVASDEVAADRDRVALVRGPIVYCIEGPDIPGGKVLNVVLPDENQLAHSSRPDLLNGVEVVSGTAQYTQPDDASSKPDQDTSSSYSGMTTANSPPPTHFDAIPYYAWAHRGKSEMTVWIPRSVEKAEQSESTGSSASTNR